jgi:uncharacterized protein (DUF433 family)
MIAIPDDFPVPLRRDSNGKIRIGDTRILLELIIHAYLHGESVEEIVDSYPTLKLSDVYAVLAYYLTHRMEIDAYVREADQRTDQIQHEIEAAYPPETLALRARLRALRDNCVPSTLDFGGKIKHKAT